MQKTPQESIKSVSAVLELYAALTEAEQLLFHYGYSEDSVESDR